MSKKLGLLSITLTILSIFVFSYTSKAATFPSAEAESGFLSFSAEVGNDSNASGGQYVFAPPGTGRFTDGDEMGPIIAEYDFYLDSAGEYYLWARVSERNSRHNSFWLQIDDDDPIKWKIDEEDDWHWEKKELGDLSAGQHTFYLICREDDTWTDY